MRSAIPAGVVLPVEQNGNPARDNIEHQVEDLILMTSGQGTRRWRQRKGDYLKKLEQDNSDLKTLNVELHQKISALQAQKDILRDQLSYFQACLAQAGFMFQPKHK